jgi:hypothetical protein
VRRSPKSTTKSSAESTNRPTADAVPPAAKRARAPPKRLADKTNQDVGTRTAAKERKRRREEEEHEGGGASSSVLEEHRDVIQHAIGESRVITGSLSYLSTPARRYRPVDQHAIPSQISTPAGSPPPLPATKRARGPTKRLAEATNQRLESQANRLAVKDKKRRREEARIQQAQMDTMVERAGDNDEVRRLKGT